MTPEINDRAEENRTLIKSRNTQALMLWFDETTQSDP